jgi:hypothetical protein
VLFFAVLFFAVLFFAVLFFAVLFFAVLLFAVLFFAVLLRAPPFFAVLLRPPDRFDDALPPGGGGTFSPFSRASDSPIAIACSRLRTLPPCPCLPRFSVPVLRRCIALLTDLPAPRLYFRPPDFPPDFVPDFALDFVVAIAAS